uniref:Flavin-containing monooxygenase n=1 Tax=Aegilops tauschii subsp. strangulata TaxID=200361 RepID=A0A453LJV2_AEGTS
MGASGSGAGSSPRSTSAVRQRTRPTGGSAGPAQEVHEFDFLILCIGMFSGVPNTPAVFPGPEAFRGRVLHSMELSDMAHADAAPLVKGKRVVVVGSRKSAFEIANDCAEANGAGTPCTMVCRNPQWMLHRADVWRGVSLAYLYMNRFAELMVPRPGAGARRLPRRHHAARAPRVGDISGDGGVVPEGDPDAGARHGARARLGEVRVVVPHLQAPRRVLRQGEGRQRRLSEVQVLRLPPRRPGARRREARRAGRRSDLRHWVPRRREAEEHVRVATGEGHHRGVGAAVPGVRAPADPADGGGGVRRGAERHIRVRDGGQVGGAAAGPRVPAAERAADGG